MIDKSNKKFWDKFAKFDITKHKNYKLLEDYDNENLFDVEEYLKQKGRAKLTPNTRIFRVLYI